MFGQRYHPPVKLSPPMISTALKELAAFANETNVSLATAPCVDGVLPSLGFFLGYINLGILEGFRNLGELSESRGRGSYYANLGILESCRNLGYQNLSFPGF